MRTHLRLVAIAAQFAAFVAGADGQAILARYGFGKA